MSEQVPNVHDPDVREMVLRNHQPEEVWTVGGELLGVHCQTCHQKWPCTTVEAARAVDSP